MHFSILFEKSQFSHHIASEAILEANLGQLGAPRASQEQLWSGLGRSWGGLGRSWGGLGAIFGWSWGGLGRSDRDRFGRKIVPKPINIQDGLRRRIWIDLGSVGGSIWGGFGVDWGGFSGFFKSFLEVARSREEMCHKCPESFFQEANSLKGCA